MRHKLPKKLKIVGDVAKSCERMRATLDKVQKILNDARREDGAAIAEGRPGSWRHLSAAICTLRSMMRPDPGTLAWHTEIDYYLDREPHLRWSSDIPPLVPGDGEGLAAIEFINGKAGKRRGGHEDKD